MNNNSLESQEKLYQLANLQEQIKTFRAEFDGMKNKIGKLDDAVSNPPVIDTGGMINLINNSDFTFNDAGYNDASYVDSAEYAADWYAKTQGTAAWLLSTLPAGAVSTQALKNDNTLNSYWGKTTGLAHLGGGYALGQKFARKYFSAGNKVFVRFQIAKKDDATTIEPTTGLKVSIYDNTTGTEGVIEGETLVLDSSTVGVGGGTHTRKYILEILTPSGTFYSDVTSAGVGDGQVNNAYAIGFAGAEGDYTNIQWDEVIDQQAYRLYRWADDDANWRLIADINTGITNWRDRGGTNFPVSSVPVTQVNPKAQAIIPSIGAGITTALQEVVMSIRVPSAYDFSTTTEQWLQIEFIKSDGTPTTVTEIPLGGITIDKVGVSLANGRWLPSAKDQQTLAAVQTTTPPATGGGEEPPYYPPEGGGGLGCVVPTALVMAVNEATGLVEEVFAKNVYVGMRLKGKTSQGVMGESKVKRIFKGRTKKVYNVITDRYGFCLPCSPTHPIIQSVGDFKGISAHELDRIQLEHDIPILVSPDGLDFYQDFLSAVEVIQFETEVITFEMEDSTVTFIANKIVTHNLEYKDHGYGTV